MAGFSKKEALANLQHDSLEIHIGPNPKTVRGAPTKIYAHPSLPKIIYPSGKYIVVRDIEDPTDCFIYRGHNAQTTVARFSPSGFWVASGDASGKVRIWSWDHPEHILKKEVMVVTGEVKDLDWSPDSRRIVASGEAQGQMARVFMWDTGNSVGNLVGHNLRVSACAYRPVAPFKIVTGSEDSKTIFSAGPPFRLQLTNSNHTNFVNAVAFNPQGDKVVSVGSDSKIFVYDGESGETIQEVPNDHTGSIYSLSWNGDGTQFVTSAADKTVKLWDASSFECIKTFTLSPDPQLCDMQVGVVWAGAYIISLSLAGDLNYLVPDSDGPVRTVQSHQVAMTAMCVDPTTQRIVTGAYDGVLMQWENGLAQRYKGTISRTVNNASHSGMVSGVTLSADMTVSIGWDDKLRFANSDLEYIAEKDLNGQPSAVVSSGTDVVIVTTTNGVFVYTGGEVTDELTDLSYTATSIAIFRDEEVAIGGSDNLIHIFSLESGSLTESQVLEGHRGQVTALDYNSEGTRLAAGDGNREVMIWQRDTWTQAVKGVWLYHTTKITSVKWNPSGELVASTSLDGNVFVWSPEHKMKRIGYQFAHKDGGLNVGWLSDDQLISSGMDQCICFWNIAQDAASTFKK